jgi:hypothetical protein
VWRTFGFAVGVLVFSVTAALVIGDQEKVAVLAAIALIRSLQLKAFASIQPAPTLSAIAGQGRSIIDDLYPRPCPAGRQPAAPLPPRRRAILWPHRQAISARSDRSSSAPVILAVVSGLPSSAGLIVVPACPAASRRRSRHADTRVWPRPAQYSGGRPVPAAGAAGCPQPGYLQVVRAMVVVLIGPPRRSGLRSGAAIRIAT